MKKHILSSLLLPVTMLVAQAASAEVTVLEVDFAKELGEVHLKDKGSYDGFLPAGCTADFVGWTTSAVSSKIMSEGSRSFLRINASKLEPGAQFNWKPEGLKLPGCYRLTVVGRYFESEPSFGIRQLPPPYRTFWSQSMTSSHSEFVERSFLINIKESSEESVGLFLYLGAGDLDLASFKLSRLSDTDMLSMFQRPPKDCANFFRNSRFPLGLQSGWSFDGDLHEGGADPDEANIGPSGTPSLKISILQNGDEHRWLEGLYSEPFQTSNPFVQNHVSFACKGNGEWSVAVLGDTNGEILASVKLNADGAWKNAKIDFKPLPSSRSFTVKFAGKGELWLDSLMAWVGNENASYVSQGECEVALGFPKSDLSSARIQFADEPAKFNYLVTGEAKGSVLKSKLVNLYGVEKTLPDIASPGRGEADLSQIIANAPLGEFRVECWVERNGKRISPYNEIVITRIRRPVHWNEDAPDSPFGCHFIATPSTIQILKSAGINWVRFHDTGTDYTGWYHLETQKGRWTFHDDAIKRYRDSHIMIFAGLQTAPKWASFYMDSGKKDFNGYFDRYFQPKDLDAWSNYVRVLTARYKGVIDEYFIWNEPWSNVFWHSAFDASKKDYLSGPTPAADYARLSIAAYKAAKEGNPSAKIAGFNSEASDAHGSQWVKGVYDAGAYPYCDVVD